MVRSPAEHGSRRVWVCETMRESKREKERERGKDSLPVTRKSNKGKKSSISPAKCTPGRRKGGRASTRKRERLWTDTTPARLQIYNYQALRALPCLFLQPVKTNCSHVSITHILFLLIRLGRGFGCCIISLSNTWVLNAFLWGNRHPRESPHMLFVSPHSPQSQELPCFLLMSTLSGTWKHVMETHAARHLWCCCHRHATFSSWKLTCRLDV